MVVRGAPRQAGRIDSRRSVWAAALRRQGASPACGPGLAQRVTQRGVRWGRRRLGGSGASCCVARGVPEVLQVGAVPLLPVSMRRRLQGGELVSVYGGGGLG